MSKCCVRTSTAATLCSAAPCWARSRHLLKNDSDVAYRAVGFVQALRIPGDLYRDFVERNSLYRSIVQARQESNFLRRTWPVRRG